jgi:hypothetical protein
VLHGEEGGNALPEGVPDLALAVSMRRRDVTYIVRNGEVKIVNTSTGRVLPDTRYMDDLHQVRLFRLWPELPCLKRPDRWGAPFRLWPELPCMKCRVMGGADSCHEEMISLQTRMFACR